MIQFLRDRELTKRISPFLQKGWSLLDIGTGRGTMALLLRQQVGVEPTLTDVVNQNQTDLPWVNMISNARVDVADKSFDAVSLIFVLHHVQTKQEQEKLIQEAARIARKRIVILEDTPNSKISWLMNAAWDWIMNAPKGIPVPFNFRSKKEWQELFDKTGLNAKAYSFRPFWPVMLTYQQTLFVIDLI
ncbi:MAG: class I SAM-dependent methyltransferase [Candidatus Doudnabacteria bacterium]|nr:class I SAM-dependent methyltransferase [Candidatus Doudnabacteria bacterium]